MKKSTLIGLVVGALALASCSSYGGAYGSTYRSGASVVIGVHDYDYGYRSSVYRPGFYYYGGYYYPSVHPYYRNYHRQYRQWRHWGPRDWAYYERHHRNWRSYKNWNPAKHWQPRPHDRKAWAKYERDRKVWRDRDRHPARDSNRNWRPKDHDRKGWNRGDRGQKKAPAAPRRHQRNR